MKTTDFITFCQRLLPRLATKKEQLAYSERLIYEVLEGSISPIDLAIVLRSLKEICDTVLKNEEFVEAIQNEVQSFGKEKATRYGVEVDIRNSTTRYDYSETKEWNSINSEFEAIKERKRLLEEALRLLKFQNELNYQKGLKKSKENENCYYIDTETGEEIELTSPAKAIKGTCIVLTFPKEKPKTEE